MEQAEEPLSRGQAAHDRAAYSFGININVGAARIRLPMR